MALFNIRLPRFKASTEAITPAPTESIEAMRRRARHRLMGATVLVLGVVLVFPLVFDTQPRPIPVDVPIAIPDRAKAKPLMLPASAPEPAASVAAAAPVEPIPVEVQLPASSAKPAPQPVRPPVVVKPEVKPKPEPKAEAKPEPKVEAKARPADTKPEPDPRAAADAGQRAQDLLNGRKDSTPAATDSGRFVVQAGSYTDAAKAHEARLKIEKAGLATYTQVVESKNGDKRIRVRIGPFASKIEADKAASRLRSLDLSVAILSL